MGACRTRLPDLKVRLEVVPRAWVAGTLACRVEEEGWTVRRVLEGPKRVRLQSGLYVSLVLHGSLPPWWQIGSEKAYPGSRWLLVYLLRASWTVF